MGRPVPEPWYKSAELKMLFNEANHGKKLPLKTYITKGSKTRIITTIIMYVLLSNGILFINNNLIIMG